MRGRMEKYLEFVGKSALFRGVEDVLPLLEFLSARTARFAKGEYVLRSGEEVTRFGLLLRGKLTVEQEDYWGNRHIVSRILPGQTFAEVFACSPGARLNVAVLAEEESEALFLDGRRLMDAGESGCPGRTLLLRNLVRDFAGKNLQLNRKATLLSQRSTREKILCYLSGEARRSGSAAFEIPFDRQQLADYLCVDRSGLSAELSRLKAEGRIDYRKNRFILHSGA